MQTIRHGYTVGQSGTGKTHLNRSIATTVSRTGKGIIVHDPIAAAPGKGVNGWPAGAIVLNDFEQFEDVFWKSRDCLVIIDEAPEVFAGDHLMRARRLVLRGRHQGHVCMMIAQRHVLMDKSARNQASDLFAFCVDPKDSATLAEEWNCEALRNCHKLRPRQFYRLARHGTAQLCQL